MSESKSREDDLWDSVDERDLNPLLDELDAAFPGRYKGETHTMDGAGLWIGVAQNAGKRLSLYQCMMTYSSLQVSRGCR